MANPNLLNTHQAPANQETKYRFAEIEMAHFARSFGYYMRTLWYDGNLTNKLELDTNEQQRNAFLEMLQNEATEEELVQLLRFNNVSYGRIKELTGIHQYKVAKYKDKKPNLKPIFPYWDEELLARWSRFKEGRKSLFLI